MTIETPTPTPTPTSRHTPASRASKAWWLLPLALATVAVGWWYQRQQHHLRSEATSSAQRVQALESRVEGLRRDVSGHSQRLQQADSTNRVLRDEVLGIGQRAALLENSLAKLADANRHGVQALRLDQVELLLALGEQRLRLSADLEGAKHAYALAAGVLDGVDSPGYLNLRQSLAQERAALDALQNDPSMIALARLETFAKDLPDAGSPVRTTNHATTASWWERVLGRVVSVRRDNDAIAVASEDRSAGQIALELELSLARTAITRRDDAAYRAALDRADRWLLRLWPDSTQRRGLQQQLETARESKLQVDEPTLGTTLKQLRAQQSGS